MRSTNSKPQQSNQFSMDKIKSRFTFMLFFGPTGDVNTSGNFKLRTLCI